MLLNVLSSVVTEDVVKGLEGILGPDDESTEVTTRGELEEIESANVANINTREISSGSFDEVVLISVDDEGTLSKDVSGVTEFTLSTSDLSGISGSLEIVRDTEVLEGSEEGLGGLNVEGVNDEGEFGSTHNSVTSSKNKRSHS
jgi:hypothetical protein